MAGSYHEIIAQARQAEAGDPNGALKLYQEAIKKEPHEELPYDRMMTLYRKQRNYKAELVLVNKAIHVFEEFYDSRTQKRISRNPAAGKLSNALARALGQKDKNKEGQYLPQPLPRWMKRKETVEKNWVKNKPDPYSRKSNMILIMPRRSCIFYLAPFR